MTSLHWQTSLQNRQCHAICTLVKQACVDLVSDLFVYYRLGCEPFVCSWDLHVHIVNVD